MKQISAFIVLLLCTLAVTASAQDLTNVNFHLRDLDGKQQSFRKYMENVQKAGEKGAVLISFWALWCEPCKQEMRAMVDVYEKFKDRNFHFLAINLDNPRSLARVKSYVTAQKLPYDFWLDSNSEAFKKLNGQSMPYSLLVNARGELIAKHTGFIHGDEKAIEEKIRTILE
jgi:cytochrome c biogenesis protein CcmG, thiol:disulfide interchange protein DsbE